MILTIGEGAGEKDALTSLWEAWSLAFPLGFVSGFLSL